MSLASKPVHPRPLSPHLSIWKIGPHMLVSIVHRITGDGLAIVGGMLFIWWLTAAATSAEAYATFTGWMGWAPFGFPLSLIVFVGLTWAFFEHMFSGIRHLVMDTGAGYELKRNKAGALAVMLGAPVATLLTWIAITRSVS